LNFSEAYGKLFKRLYPLASALEQVVYKRDRIFEIVREAFHERNPLILETLLDLVVPLARDLQGDFYFFYKQSLFEDIVTLLLHSKQEQNEINTQLLEQVFQCLTYLFKYLWRIILKDLASLHELYSKFLFSSSTTNATTTN
jgi:U3 small nucleolar RNA-associated protein 20